MTVKAAKLTAKEKERIIYAATLSFSGWSQNKIAEHLGVSQTRVSQLQNNGTLWAETIEQLRSTKLNIEAEIVREQNEKYSAELREWIETSERMSKVDQSLYSKYMRLLVGAIDEALTIPSPIRATVLVKDTLNLVRATTELRERIDKSFDQRLGITEMRKQLEQLKNDELG